MTQERKQRANAILNQLQHYTGDLERCRHSLNPRLIYTPGVQCLAELAEAYWLIDTIASWIGSSEYREAVRKDDRIESLHFWHLKVKDNTAVLFARADSEEEPFITQAIPFTDFPLDEIDLWVGFDGAYWTLYLPSEH